MDILKLLEARNSESSRSNQTLRDQQPLSALMTGPSQHYEVSSVPAKRPALFPVGDSPGPPKKRGKWTPEEDELAIKLRQGGMKWDDIAKRLPGRSAISCRLRYGNYCEAPLSWDDEKKNKLARLYNRFKQSMWEMVAKEMSLPWRAIEASHWQMGPEEMASRANVPVFQAQTSRSPRPTATRAVNTVVNATRRIKIRSRRRLPIEAHNVLQEWLQNHIFDPYPSSDEKKGLASKTRLTVKQVSTWFTNNRKRQLDPLDQWLSGSSEDEAASPKDISRAIRNGSISTPNLSRSISYAGSEPGSASSANSAFSQCDDAVWSGPHRQGKRKHVTCYGSGNTPNSFSILQASQGPVTSPFVANTPSVAPLKQFMKPIAQYQCTFCHLSLSPKAWKRHEETRHLPRAQWTCMANGSTFSRPANGSLDDIHHTLCVFCEVANPELDHSVQCHRASECMSKLEIERTFARKDGLVQHLKGFHDASLPDAVIESWKREPDYSYHKWNCGFCGKKLENWNIRASHIAEHFREGLTMATWNSTRTEGDKLFTNNAPQQADTVTSSDDIHLPDNQHGQSTFQVSDCLHLDDPAFWAHQDEFWDPNYPIDSAPEVPNARLVLSAPADTLWFDPYDSFNEMCDRDPLDLSASLHSPSIFESNNHTS